MELIRVVSKFIRKEVARLSKLSNNFKNHKLFNTLLSTIALKQFRRYIATGLMAAALEYLVFNIMYHYLEVLYIPNSTGMAAGFILSFVLNRIWSFESKGNAVKQFCLNLALFCLNLLISNYVIHLLSDRVGMIPALSKVIVMGIIITWNFVIYRKIIYKK